MNKEIVDELVNLYKRSVEDNKEDFIRIMTTLNKLCAYLLCKSILTEEEIKTIFEIEKLESKDES